jgi:hypothetical protein
MFISSFHLLLLLVACLSLHSVPSEKLKISFEAQSEEEKRLPNVKAGWRSEEENGKFNVKFSPQRAMWRTRVEGESKRRERCGRSREKC